MTELPELVGICLCERVSQDIFRNDAVTLVNVHNSFSSTSFPSMIPIIYAFAQLRGLPEAFTYQFSVLGPEGEVIASSAPGQVDPLPTTESLHRILSAFPGLILPAPGSYKVILKINEKLVGVLPLMVELVSAG
ncbi:MAG: hypothetical protein C0508_19935 [Cyanobacteria bacterium PR.023]|jgi:hypothetical protein|nr:hypothetical protein [Cyanobacteria bacterium PR.023]MDQ5936601.1 hypothetical protein [Cyanobacteriota bacterium erpe_2018_sw_21hr_WHONDRS-SW48-000092_B_bin.40]